MSDHDPATEALLADLQHINETPAIKLAEEVGAPTIGMEAADYLANSIDEDANQVKQANDLREGIIDDETLKLAAEKAAEDKGEDDDEGEEKGKKAPPFGKQHGKGKGKGDCKMAEEEDLPWGKEAADLPPALDLEFWTQTGPEEVTTKFAEGFMEELQSHGDEFGKAYDDILAVAVR